MNMNLSFRRNSTAATNVTPEKPKDEEDESSKKSAFNFGDMGKNFNMKKIFQKDEGESGGTGFMDFASTMKRSKSNAEDAQSARVKQVISLLEEFRLQCPQTHAGLVIAFTATTLSPLTDADVKFKWYRMDKEQDQFLQIDQGTRAWYPPTADDIGKRICAQCEDSFEQGYCRYAETGPIDADPLLRSMTNSALQNGSYTIKDVSVSFGVNILDPEVNEMVSSFDMHAKQRLSALEQSPAPVGPGGFVQFERRLTVEADKDGIFISFGESGDGAAPGSSPMSTHGNKKGIRIKSSPDLIVQCALPATLIVSVPWPAGIRRIAAETASAETAATTGGEDADVAKEQDPSAGDLTEINEEENAAKQVTQLVTSSSEDAETSLLPIHGSPWTWVGEMSGTAFDQVESFFTNLGSLVPEFRICLACGDRMQRDTMALSIRTLAAFDSAASIRDRIAILPWYGLDVDSSKSVQSMAGSELGTRLKELELENTALKRERDELNLQLLETGHSFDLPVGSHSSALEGDAEPSGGDDDCKIVRSASSGDVPDQLASYRAKVKSLENEILIARRKEMEVEQGSLELEVKIGRLNQEIEAQKKNVSELKEKLTEAENALSQSESHNKLLQARIESMEDAMKSVDSNRLEVENANSTLREMENEIVSVRKALEESELRHKNQISETRLIAAELVEAQAKAKESEELAGSTSAKCAELEKQLEAITQSLDELKAEHDVVCAQKKALEEAAFTAELYEEALDTIDKLEGEKNSWKHKSESLAKDVKRLLKQIDDIHSTTSYQLKEASRALEVRNEEYRALEATLAANNKSNQATDNPSNRRMSIFGRKGSDA